MVSSRPTEVAADVAQAHQAGRIDIDTHDAAVRALDQVWAQTTTTVIPLDQALVVMGRQLPFGLLLRAHDAVNCAPALLVSDQASSSPESTRC